MPLAREFSRLRALVGGCSTGDKSERSTAACGPDFARQGHPARALNLPELLGAVWTARKDTVWTIRDLVRSGLVANDHAVTRALGFALGREADNGERVERAGRANDGGIWRLRW